MAMLPIAERASGVLAAANFRSVILIYPVYSYSRSICQAEWSAQRRVRFLKDTPDESHYKIIAHGFYFFIVLPFSLVRRKLKFRQKAPFDENLKLPFSFPEYKMHVISMPIETIVYLIEYHCT